jgi:hypothetical protein
MGKGVSSMSSVVKEEAYIAGETFITVAVVSNCTL